MSIITESEKKAKRNLKDRERRAAQKAKNEKSDVLSDITDNNSNSSTQLVMYKELRDDFETKIKEQNTIFETKLKELNINYETKINELEKKLDKQKEKFDKYKEKQVDKFNLFKDEQNRRIDDEIKKYITSQQLQQQQPQQYIQAPMEFVSTAAPAKKTEKSSPREPVPKKNKKEEIKTDNIKEYLMNECNDATPIKEFNFRYIKTTLEDVVDNNISLKQNMKKMIDDAIKVCIKKDGGLPIKCIDVKKKHYFLRVDELKNDEVFYDDNNMWIECYEGKTSNRLKYDFLGSLFSKNYEPILKKWDELDVIMKNAGGQRETTIDITDENGKYLETKTTINHAWIDANEKSEYYYKFIGKDGKITNIARDAIMNEMIEYTLEKFQVDI